MKKLLSALIIAFSLFNPSYAKDKEFPVDEIPSAGYELVRYNEPPGSRELNLESLIDKKQLNLNAVASSDLSWLAYTEVYTYSQANMTASSIYLIKLDKSLNQVKSILNANVADRIEPPILETDISNAESFLFQTLTIVDWNIYGDKILIKKKVGKNYDRIFATTLYVYDMAAKKAYELDEVRKAIKYYWKNKNVRLDDYKWDIKPLGWDYYNPERIIVEAYGNDGDVKKFLGTWSVNFDGDMTLLLSNKKKYYRVAQNGFCLRKVR